MSIICLCGFIHVIWEYSLYPLGSELQIIENCPTWILEVVLWSSQRTSNALNHFSSHHFPILIQGIKKTQYASTSQRYALPCPSLGWSLNSWPSSEVLGLSIKQYYCIIESTPLCNQENYYSVKICYSRKRI